MSDQRLAAARFAPIRPDETLLFIGQDLGSVAEYAAGVTGGRVPSGVTTYTAIRDGDADSLNGLWSEVDYGAGRIDATALLRAYPGAALSVGLDLVGALDGIAAGRRDAVIDRLGQFLRDAARPVFLRIGYEFDGPWNRYEPEAYKAAFRRIVSRMRGAGVGNFATVWQSATSGMGTFGGRSIWDWWPGDEYVDWAGLSYFVPHAASLDALLGAARYKHVPVMICESAPQGYDLARSTVGSTDGGGGGARTPVSSADIWSRWFAPFFSFIRRNSDVIRSVSYVRCLPLCATQLATNCLARWAAHVVTDKLGRLSASLCDPTAARLTPTGMRNECGAARTATATGETPGSTSTETSWRCGRRRSPSQAGCARTCSVASVKEGVACGWRCFDSPAVTRPKCVQRWPPPSLPS